MLTPAQSQLLQRLHTISDALQVPWPLRPFRPLIRGAQWIAQRLFDTRYPLDTRVLLHPDDTLIAAPRLVVLVGVSHLWAVQRRMWGDLAVELTTHFSRVRVPRWHFSQYPVGVRQLFSLAAHIWYGGFWEGNVPRVLSPNPIARTVVRGSSDGGTSAQTGWYADSPIPLTRSDCAVATAAVPLLGTLLASMAGVFPHWLLGVQFCLAFRSLYLPHGSRLKKIIHPLGDALVHRPARVMTEVIHTTAAEMGHDEPPCFMMGSLCYLGVLELLKAKGYREVALQ